VKFVAIHRKFAAPGTTLFEEPDQQKQRQQHYPNLIPGPLALPSGGFPTETQLAGSTGAAS